MAHYRPPSPPRIEHVFTCGTDIGIGTCGLGANRAQYANETFTKNRMAEYWAQKEEEKREAGRRERERLEKIRAAQAGSSRQRLQAAMIQHVKDIQRMVAERKKFEKEAKEKRDAEAKARNDLIVKENKIAQEESQRARQRREEMKIRELAELRKRRREALEIREMDAEAEKEIALERIERLREIHHQAQEEAARAAAERFTHKLELVKETREKQQHREEEIKEIRVEIKQLKGEMIQRYRMTEPVARHRARSQLNASISRSGVRQREDWKKTEQQLKQGKEEYKRSRAQSAELAKREARARRKAYEDEKKRQFCILQREAKELKDRQKAEIEAEKEELRQEHAEYITLMRELLSRTEKSPSPNRSKGKSPDEFFNR